MIPIIKINDYQQAQKILERLKKDLRRHVQLDTEEDGYYVIYIEEAEAEAAGRVVQAFISDLKEQERHFREENRAAWESNGQALDRTRTPRKYRSVLGSVTETAGPVTLGVSALTLLVFAAQCVAPDRMMLLLGCPGFDGGDPLTWHKLLTPVLLHFGLIHLGFNLGLWIWLAGRIERFLGHGTLLALLILGSLIPDYTQLTLTGPAFGGMSGLVMALISFCWIVSALAPDRYAPVNVPPGFMIVTVIFALLGLADIIPGISTANAVHLTGLLLGGAFGLYHALVLKGACRSVPRETPPSEG